MSVGMSSPFLPIAGSAAEGYALVAYSNGRRALRCCRCEREWDVTPPMEMGAFGDALKAFQKAHGPRCLAQRRIAEAAR